MLRDYTPLTAPADAGLRLGARAPRQDEIPAPPVRAAFEAFERGDHTPGVQAAPTAQAPRPSLDEFSRAVSAALNRGVHPSQILMWGCGTARDLKEIRALQKIDWNAKLRDMFDAIRAGHER